MAVGVSPEIDYQSHLQEISMRCLLILVAVLLAGCETQNKQPPPMNESQDIGAPTSFTGTLQSGVLAVGGEHTGWIIAADGAAGGLEVDVSKVREDARGNDGKRVTVTGKVINKTYPERGKVMVIVADSIKPAPKANPNKAAHGVG